MSNASECSVSVLQWNVLADGLAQCGGFAKVPQELLEWEARAPVILSTILMSMPDIVCLQEVNHYDDYLLPAMMKEGYQGLFQAKLQSTAEGSIVCRFKEIATGGVLIVANTHLKAKGGEENEAARLMQAQQLLQRLHKAASGTGETAAEAAATTAATEPAAAAAAAAAVAPADAAALIVCGDFNTGPQSAVWHLMRDHPLAFRSAYAYLCECAPPHAAGGEGGGDVHLFEGQHHCEEGRDGGAHAEPPYTTWKFRSDEEEKKSTIDFIWYSDGARESEQERARSRVGLYPCRRWHLPDQDAIGPTGLPTGALPSDHLALMCEFKWRQLQVESLAPMLAQPETLSFLTN
eukprot:jgi/Mesen1/4152/ME000219S03283